MSEGFGTSGNSDDAANSDSTPAGVSRRNFLRDVAALTVTGSVLAGCARSASAASSGAMSSTASGRAGLASSIALKPTVDGIGVQLYTVADQLRTDFDGTMEKVAQIGYKQVEFAGYNNKTPEQVRALLDRLKLKSPSTHIGLDALRKDLDAQIHLAQVVGHEYITIPSLGRTETPMNTIDAWKRISDECNTMGAKLKSHGLKLAFHSHSSEFVDVGGGKTGMDVFISETDPSVFNFQMDLGWARVASQDPVKWFKKYPDRFCMWHVKDFENLRAAQDRETITLRNAAAATPRPASAAPPVAPAGGVARGAAGGAPPAPQPGRPCPVGSGDVDFRPIIAEWKVSGMRYFFVEQDGAAQWPGGSMASIATSYQTLRRLLA
ncbi:MAG: sugar phosphate isomerase/epimerase [Gemmatimonadaceae bacterium]